MLRSERIEPILRITKKELLLFFVQSPDLITRVNGGASAMKAFSVVNWLLFALFSASLLGCRLEIVDEQQDDASSEDGDAVVLEAFAEGFEPTQGFMGSKQIRVLATEPEFLEVWPQYMPKSMPIIDFIDHSVLLFDRGQLDLNRCLPQKKVSSVVSYWLDDNTLQIDIQWENQCPVKDQSCRTEVDVARPFAFYQLEKADNVFIAEYFDEKVCE